MILMEFCAECLPRFHEHGNALALVTLCPECGAKLAQVGRLMCPLKMPGAVGGTLHSMGLVEHDGNGNVKELDRDPVAVIFSVEDKMVAMEIGFSDGGPVEKNVMSPKTARAMSRQLAEAAISAEKRLKFRIALKIGRPS